MDQGFRGHPYGNERQLRQITLLSLLQFYNHKLKREDNPKIRFQLLLIVDENDRLLREDLGR